MDPQVGRTSPARAHPTAPSQDARLRWAGGSWGQPPAPIWYLSRHRTTRCWARTSAHSQAGL